MTKQEYIQKHPKSTLAVRLACNNWPNDQKIEVIGGLDAPHTKCSNLYHALAKAELKDYCRGGHRRRGTEGWWIAVA